MANERYSSQRNYVSQYERNTGITQGNNFSGRVVESLQNAPPSGHDVQDIVWGPHGVMNAPRDTVDGMVVSHRTTSTLSRSDVRSYRTSEMISPTERSQEESDRNSRPHALITVRRRRNLDDTLGGSMGLSEEEKQIVLSQRRGAFVQEYHDLTDPTMNRLVDLCAPILNIDVAMERKYAELDIWRVLEANQEKSHFLHLTQGLGILEKYASNLIKESRPPYWRTVKFTSSLIQVHVGRLIGSRDILSQIGYTQDIDDGVSFPSSVIEPDVERLKKLAPDLFIARYEIDALLVNNHPYYELDPMIPQDEVQLPVLMRVDFPPSTPLRFPPRETSALLRSPQAVVAASRSSTVQPFTSPTERRNQSPIPAARRHRGREPLSPPEGKECKTTIQCNQETHALADRNIESEEDSEYEDAEDGLLPSNHGAVVQTNFECRVCGESIATKFCKDCKDTFCGPCDELYHKHPSRQRHIRTDLAEATSESSQEQPVVGATSVSGSTFGAEQQPIRVASAVSAVTSAGLESRPRPVPAPRRNKTPLPSHQNVTQNTSIAEPVMAEVQTSLHPPRRDQRSSSPSFGGVSQLTASSNTSVVTSSAVLFPPPIATRETKGTSKSSPAQSQERKILRPPPFEPPAAFNTSTWQHTSEVSDERDSKPVEKSQPSCTVPLKSSSLPKPKVPVESRSVIQAPSIRDNAAALSCPNCFCLNSGDHKICLFCKKPLPIKTQRESSNLSGPSGHGQNVETRNLPPPALQSSQQQMQMQGNASTMTSSGAVVDPDKWECEYCTYHNPRTRRICEICCKSGNNLPPPARSDESPGFQKNTQIVTNMAMQSEVQPLQSTAETIKKMDAQILQAPLKEMPVRAAQANHPEQPITTAFQGMGISGQVLPMGNFFPGMTSYNPGGMTTISEEPVRNPFMRDPGLPFGRQGFPMPPPAMQLGGAVGPELPAPGPFPAPPPPTPFLQQGFTTGFPQPPPSLATTWPTNVPDESVRRQQEEIFIAGSRYVEWLRKAEKEGFTAEELNIASVLAIDDPEGPVHWLHTAWYDLIHKVMVELAVPENSQEIGNVSPEEVREALIECTGEVSRATAKCVEIRKKKVKELQQAGVYAKTDCISALDSAEGDSEKAILSLEKMAMRPMLQRVLNSCLPDHATQDEVFRVLTRQVDTQNQQDKANFEAIVKDKAQNLDRRIRAVLAEKNIPSWGRAETAIKLIDMNYAVEDSVEAARSCGDVQRSLRFLQQECPLCFELKPMSQMVTFLHCQDRVCQDCVTPYITITIKDKNILKLVCPVCSQPENLDDEVVATEYFNNFDILIRGLVDQETHDLFQRKLRDRTLMKEPNFRWCSHCSSGFINEQRGQLKMMCPHCRLYTCFKCKRQWEDQHEGISCEQFEAWKAANDPEFQAAGLAAHLKMNGIVCPGCKYRYDLSKGGCMHFKCAMCPHEFCSGCYNPFIKTDHQNCHISEQCRVKGLHAHHPRDCYFYLRDRSPEELQRLLDDNDVAYNKEPPDGQGNTSSDEEEPLGAGAAAAAAPLHCNVSEQKESENGGLVDAECGAEVNAGHAGLCRKHYVEYLIVLVNDNLMDPADIMSSNDLIRVLERGFVPPPVKTNRMTDEQYRQLLLQTVKEKLPLPAKSPRKRILDDEDDIQVVQNISDEDVDLDDRSDSDAEF